MMPPMMPGMGRGFPCGGPGPPRDRRDADRRRRSDPQAAGTECRVQPLTSSCRVLMSFAKGFGQGFIKDRLVPPSAL